MGNGVVVKSEGKCIVVVQTKKGTRMIKDVLYVPSLDQNLLSVPQMMENGYTIHFEGNTCAIYDPKGNNIACVKMQKNCFPIEWNYKAQEQSMQTRSNELTWLWQKRLGHYNSKNLKSLSDKDIVNGFPQISETIGVCDACQLGKCQERHSLLVKHGEHKETRFSTYRHMWSHENSFTQQKKVLYPLH